MSHCVHPYSHRIGILRDWKSRWFGVNKKYRDYFKADILMRRFLEKKLANMFVGGIDIERSDKGVRVVIKTSRPGLIIGRNGEGAVALRKDLEKFMHKNKIWNDKADLKIDIEEIRSPESSAQIVGLMIKDSLEKRLPFRRVMKMMIEKVMSNRDVKGIRIRIGGRLNGTDIARSEELKKGRIPLQTFRADIDFARVRASIAQGDLGIKVWIYRGEIFEKDLNKKA